MDGAYLISYNPFQYSALQISFRRIKKSFKFRLKYSSKDIYSKNFVRHLFSDIHDSDYSVVTWEVMTWKRFPYY